MYDIPRIQVIIWSFITNALEEDLGCRLIGFNLPRAGLYSAKHPYRVMCVVWLGKTAVSF